MKEKNYGIDKEILEKSGATTISPYGDWEVKSYGLSGTKHYGFYKGYINDIALYIANITNPGAGTYVSLIFSRINLIKPVLPPNFSFFCKDVYFEIKDLNTVNLMAETTTQLHEYVLNKSGDEVLPFYNFNGDYKYKVILKNGRPTIHVISEEEENKNKKVNELLEKLTDEEKELLASYYS